MSGSLQPYRGGVAPQTQQNDVGQIQLHLLPHPSTISSKTVTAGSSTGGKPGDPGITPLKRGPDANPKKYEYDASPHPTTTDDDDDDDGHLNEAMHKGLKGQLLRWTANERIMANVYLVIWFILNVVITLYCKAIFSVHHFPYPMIMTVIHLAFTFLGVQICAWCGIYTPKPLTRHNIKTVIWFSVIFTLNIWLSNASLMAVSVNLHQVVRTTIPLFTMAISLLMFGESYPCSLLPSILVVIVGVSATVWGDLEFDAFGMTIVVLGCVLSSLKGILTQKTQVGSMGMSSMDLLRYLSPLAVIQLLVLSFALGEVEKLRNDTNLTKLLGFHLFTLGWVAFGINFVSFRNAALNNPLTLNIAGNVKQVVTSLLGIYIFGGALAPALTFGIFATAVGTFWYSWEMQRCRAAKRAQDALAAAENEVDEKILLKDLEKGTDRESVGSGMDPVSTTATSPASAELSNDKVELTRQSLPKLEISDAVPLVIKKGG